MSEILADCVGTVWKVLSAPGDRVSEGDVLIILESMKMEIPIEAEEDGVVVSVHVAEGAQVDDGDLLVRMGE
ncbi:biotin/lipoyl-binding carrier protein [Haloechinothrix salitolerans]|uniref:Biotin/lipoyl-binding carrier protein n=1 Tax=Haloechinothrix salitolerans TaxID=926830 RepID=A0ABW2C2W8_9PSEU